MKTETIIGTNNTTIEPPVAIYARQSIDKKDSISIETQIADCIDEYKRLGYAGPVFIFSDKGFSGKNTDRPAFQELMDLIENNKIHYVFAYKLDRISRNLYDFTQMQKKFEQHGVGFNSKNDSFDTSTPMGQTMLQIIMVFAELERKNTQQRVTDNYYHRIADSGRWGGGPAPYGFKNAKTNGVSTLEVIPEEMDVVKYIFDTYSSTPGISLGKLATDLTNKGYKARKGNFTNVSVGRILRNPIYVKADKLLRGYFETVYFENADKSKVFLNEEEQWDGKHSANIIRKRISDTRKHTKQIDHRIYITNISGIIESQQYIEIQYKLANNQQLKRSNNLGKLQELTGMLKCAKCGRSVKAYSYPSLSCYGHVEKKDCDMKIKSKNGLTAAQSFDDLRIKIGLCVTRYFVQLKKTCTRIEQKNQKDDREIAIRQQKINNLVLSLSDTPPEASSPIKARMNELSKEIAELKLHKLMRSNDRLIVEVTKNLNYFKQSPQKRQAVLRSVIDRIEINSDYSFKIIWKSKALEDIQEYDKLEYTTNGRMRIKEEIGDLSDAEIEKLVFEAVSLKVEATQYYCQMNGIKVQRSFFKPYLDNEIFIQNFRAACEDTLIYKRESTCEPVARSGIIISPFDSPDKKSAKTRKLASFRKADIMQRCIENQDTSELSANEKMTVAFSLLLPKYGDGDQIEWLANTYDPKYQKIYDFMAI